MLEVLNDSLFALQVRYDVRRMASDQALHRSSASLLQSKSAHFASIAMGPLCTVNTLHPFTLLLSTPRLVPVASTFNALVLDDSAQFH
jgi:hypothetical protein